MATQPKNKASIQIVQLQYRGALRPSEGGGVSARFECTDEIRARGDPWKGSLGKGSCLEESSEGSHGGPASRQS